MFHDTKAAKKLISDILVLIGGPSSVLDSDTYTNPKVLLKAVFHDWTKKCTAVQRYSTQERRYNDST